MNKTNTKQNKHQIQTEIQQKSKTETKQYKQNNRTTQIQRNMKLKQQYKKTNKKAPIISYIFIVSLCIQLFTKYSIILRSKLQHILFKS